MRYKLTTTQGVTNAGAYGVEVHYFDDMYELQDFIEAATFGLDDDDRELYHYYLRIDEVYPINHGMKELN